jgi:hypothetical protein
LEIILKFGFIAFVLTTLTSTAYAYECNTVMGGCPTDSNQVTSAHMHGDVAAKVATQPVAAKPTTTKNTAAQAGAGKKTGQGSLMQTINKNVLK